jgi:hypothetical protein
VANSPAIIILAFHKVKMTGLPLFYVVRAKLTKTKTKQKTILHNKKWQGTF